MARLWRSLLAVAAVVAVSCGSIGPAASNHGVALSGFVRMMDAQRGWAYGQHLIARTSDGAQTFRDVTPPGLSQEQQLDPPLFLDATHAFVFAIAWDRSTLKSSTLERTSDGGATWLATPMSPAIHGDLSFADPLHGWLVSAQDSADHLNITDTLWRTSDGGQSWSAVYGYTYRLDVHPSTQPGGCYWQGSIAWMSSTQGIVGVSCPFDTRPAVDMTDDGGSTWTRRNLPGLPARAGIGLFVNVGPVRVFAGGTVVAVVSRCVGTDGTSCTPWEEMYRSADGGVTWSTGAWFRGGNDLMTVDASHAWEVGCMSDSCSDFGLLTTGDGGADWGVLPLPAELLPNMHASRIYSFVTPGVGFATASKPFGGGYVFYKTTDGGRTFTPFEPMLEG